MSNALRYIYDDRFAETMGYEDFEADKEELDHFIRLSHAQAEQLKKYAELQKRSHTLITTLLQRLNAKGVDSA